uniref:Trafficking protein particle complex subunit 2-like protein n=1 Tax=Anopheles epiroticus TaxID=199890 RepID=A0A182PRZ2_9DIPT
MEQSKEPTVAKEAVLQESSKLPEDTPKVRGYDWNEGYSYERLFSTYVHSGFQATNLGQAIEEVNKMLAARRVPLPEDKLDVYEEDEFIKRQSSCTIFLGYTSNMVSAGVRETIRFLAQHRLVDCIVTTAGGVEEDLIKCLAPTFLGSFELAGRELRERGINRIGNLLVPNENYCKFENWVIPILDEMLEEQKSKGTLWTPSKVITRLGEKINDESSIYYWAAKNRIPVFSPALTDGSLGDMMYFHSFRNPGLVVDIVSDLRRLNTMAVKAVHSGIIIVGGGVIKHHICNANLMRNGADYSVFVNTASEYDGSDSGARPDEAVSWGKIKKDATPVKVYAEASLMCACVAIIGKDNAPLYIATANVDKEIALQYQVHASLDVIDERCATNQKAAADGRELYLGSLISTEQYKIYGYVTNTKIKFLIVIDASSTSSFRENEVRAMFRNLHNLYTDAVCNPFYTPGEPLTSASFDRAVRGIISAN